MVIIEPGPIKTPIWEKGVSMNQEKTEEDSFYNEALETFREKVVKQAVASAWTSEKAAKVIFKGFIKNKSKVRYPIVAQRLMNWDLPRILPVRLIDRAIGKRVKLIK